jgi:predicted FMN-binding regulatory protein PaiB
MSVERYGAKSPHDVVRLLQNHPLVWIISLSAEKPLATMVPVLPVVGPEGELTALSGHFARRNPQVALFRESPRALVLASGVNGYISPSWLRDRTRAPTWNYTGVRFIVDMELYEEPEPVRAHLRELVDTMETGRSNAWSVDEMGARFQSLAQGVVGFRAGVRESRATFKLGQDERDSEYQDITVALEGTELLEWMKDFNRGRE